MRQYTGVIINRQNGAVRRRYIMKERRTTMKKLLCIALALLLVVSLAAVPAAASSEPVVTGTDVSALVDGDGNLSLTDPDEDYVLVDNLQVGTFEMADGVSLRADYPVILFFEDSTAVQNGDVIDNVQYVSDYDEVIAIVHTNDVHGHLSAEPYVKGYADELKASGDYSLVLTVSAGDVYAGGEAVAQSYNGEFIPAVMDKVYDVVAPGNNDFVLNAGAKQNILLNSLFTRDQVLCANYTVNADGIDMPEYAASYGDAWIGNELFDELYDNITLDESGVICWDALDLQVYEEGDSPFNTTATFTTDNGTVVGLYGISTTGGAASTMLDSASSIGTSQACADELRADGATVVIGVGHTGWPDGDETLTASSANDTNSAQIALQTTGIDAFVDGHSHSIINNGEGWLGGESNTLVNQAACFGTEIGVMFLYVKDGVCIAKDGNNLHEEDYIGTVTPDAEVLELVTMALEKTEEDLGAPIAETPVFLNAERESAANEGGSVRSNETNMGDLMTDVIRNALTEQGYDVQFVLCPGYWLRSSVEAGDISISSVQSIFANPTVLEYVTYSASDIVAAMQKSVSGIPEDSQMFFQISGITMTYSMASGSGEVISVKVGDTMIYENGEYLVDDDWSVNGILTLTGGEIDSWTGSTDSWVCGDKTEVQELVSGYLATHEAGVDYTIFENVPAPDGRTTCID